MGERLGLNEPFDVIKMGMSPGDDPAEAAARVNSATKAGATWWLELIMPEVYGLDPTDPQAYTVLQTRVMQGPPTAGLSDTGLSLFSIIVIPPVSQEDWMKKRAVNRGVDIKEVL